MGRVNRGQILSLVVLLSIAGDAEANAGVPMIALVMPVFGISILPIIVIEAAYLANRLGLDFAQSARATVTSNVVSTLVGIPLTWTVLLVIQLLFGGGRALGMDTAAGQVLSVTLQAPWLVPYEAELYWMIPVAGLFLLIPFFFVSWWSEFLVTRRILKDQFSANLSREVRNANVITYALLAVWPMGFWAVNSGVTQ